MTKKIIKHNVVKTLSSTRMGSFGLMNNGQLFDPKLIDKLKIKISQKLELQGPENVSVVTSGSLSLWLALQVLSPKQLDLPYYCCPSINNACRTTCINTELYDCKFGSVNVDFNNSSNTNSKILVHNFGFLSSNYIANKFQIINDFTHLFGSMAVKGSKQGNALFNFASAYATKPFTMGGQGGIVWSHDTKFINEIECALNHTDPKKGLLNGKITSFQAEYGLEALDEISFDFEKRREIASLYNEIVGGSTIEFSNIRSQKEFYRFLISVPNVNQAKRIFDTFGVQAIRPIDENELHKQIKNYPISQHNMETLLSIPCYPSLSQKEISVVQNALSELLENI